MQFDPSDRPHTRVMTIDPIDWENLDAKECEVTNLDLFLRENYTSDLVRELEKHSDVRNQIEMMDHPIYASQAFRIFGCCMGLFPPFAIVGKLLVGSGDNPETLLFIILTSLAIATTAIMGWITGKFVGEKFEPLFSTNLISQIAFAVFTGAAWGAICGAVGGIFLLIVGAVIAGAFGAISTSIALPFFTIAYRWLSVDGMVERSKILPFAIGVPLIFGLMLIN